MQLFLNRTVKMSMLMLHQTVFEAFKGHSRVLEAVLKCLIIKNVSQEYLISKSSIYLFFPQLQATLIFLPLQLNLIKQIFKIIIFKCLKQYLRSFSKSRLVDPLRKGCLVQLILAREPHTVIFVGCMELKWVEPVKSLH